MEVRRRALRQVAAQLRQRSQRQQSSSHPLCTQQQQYSLLHHHHHHHHQQQHYQLCQQHQNQQQQPQQQILRGLSPWGAQCTSGTPTTLQQSSYSQHWSPQRQNHSSFSSQLHAPLPRPHLTPSGGGASHAGAAPLAESAPAQQVFGRKGEHWRGVAGLPGGGAASSAAQEGVRMSSENRDRAGADGGEKGGSEQGRSGNSGSGGSNGGQSRRGWWWISGVAAAASSATALLALSTAASAREKEEEGQGPLRPSSASDSPVSGQPKKKRVVVLGSGWAAVSFLKQLDTSGYDVTVVSPRNYFLFTPLLPGVTVGSLEARSISEPMRRILVGRRKQGQFLEAECVDIDPVRKTVRCKEVFPVAQGVAEQFELTYDELVVAVGAETNTFNTPGVKEHCHFLKEAEDAELIQKHIVDCFEAAAMPCRTAEQRQRLLTFVVVGGGPTGVEFAAELHDLIKDDLARLYPHLAGIASIHLIQSGDHILNMFDKRISEFATAKFSRDGIRLLVGKRVTAVRADAVEMRDNATGAQETLHHGGFVVWSTGIGTRPIITSLMSKVGQEDRRLVATDEWLRVKGTRDVWAIGDCATIEQRRMRDDISRLFAMADVNGDGILDEYEFKEVLKRVEERYPQIVIYLRRRTFRDLLKDMHLEEEEGEGSEEDEYQRSQHKMHHINIKMFTEAMEFVDTQLKSLPATAQVAAQQGEYLASCFNKSLDPQFEAEGPLKIREQGRHKFHPFRYKHLGQFATFGSGQAGVELPGDWVNVGKSTQWLWYSVYASKQVSWRTRALVIFDWCKRAIFGRDSSRM